MAVQQKLSQCCHQFGQQLQLCRNRRGINGCAVGVLQYCHQFGSQISIAAMQEKKGKKRVQLEFFSIVTNLGLNCSYVVKEREETGAVGALLVLSPIWASIAAVQEKNQKYLFTDSLHRLGSRFARTSSVSLEKIVKKTNSLKILQNGLNIVQNSLKIVKMV